MSSGTSSGVSKVRITTDVSPATFKGLQETIDEKWLPSLDNAVERMIDFAMPTDSYDAVNHVFLECNIVLDYVVSPKERTEFFRALYAYFEETKRDTERVIRTLEQADLLSPDSELFIDSKNLFEIEGVQVDNESDGDDYIYCEEPLATTEVKRIPLTITIGEKQFRAMKKCSEHLEYNIGILLDMITIGFPIQDGAESQALAVATMAFVNMIRLTPEQYIDCINMIMQILKFHIDSATGKADELQAISAVKLQATLDEHKIKEQKRLKMWKYENAVITTPWGIFPPGQFGQSGPQS